MFTLMAVINIAIVIFAGVMSLSAKESIGRRAKEYLHTKIAGAYITLSFALLFYSAMYEIWRM